MGTVSRIVRVLVVEDFEPFRQLTRSMLGKRSDLQIICEVSDGLEAVRKAEKLKPDLILLDVGLPTLNGFEAARQIRTASPNSKIIFVTQESAPAIVEEALVQGAMGYVVKTVVASDLLTAVDAVLGGGRFFSGRLPSQEFAIQPGTATGD